MNYNMPQMGDYPPGCKGPPEEIESNDVNLDVYIDEIVTELWLVEGCVTEDELDKLQEYIEKWVKEHS